MSTVIIFDGEKEREIGVRYFFQSKYIENLTSDQVREIYQASAVYVEAIKSLHGLGDTTEFSLVTLHKATRGLQILEQMVIDTHGEELGSIIINQAEEAIALEITN